MGSPQAGQQQLFSILTGIALETIQQKPLEAHQGVCEVRDPRVTRLAELYKPKKTTYAKIDYILLPDLKLLKNADGVCWVARAENAGQDISAFIAELIIADMMVVEKRLENIAKDQKRKFEGQREKENELMLACKQQLDREKPLSGLTLTAEQAKLMRTYQFLTLKPVILGVNVPEKQVGDSALAKELGEKFGLPAVQLCAELEEEISRLEPGDREAFMKELGIAEPAIEKMSRLAYAALGLLSFFTVGEDEVRAWTVSNGATAPDAGSVIHSDIEKGFVRAEMFKYDDFIAAGSEAKLKEQGKFHLKGRDYIVADGDILSFRFNV